MPPAPTEHTQRLPSSALPPPIPTWQFPPPPPPPPPWTSYAPPPPFRMQEAPAQQTPATMTTSMATRWLQLATSGRPSPPPPDTRKCTAQDGTWGRNLERPHSLGEVPRNILHLPLQTSSGTPSLQAPHRTRTLSWPATCNAASAPTRWQPHRGPRAQVTRARMHHQLDPQHKPSHHQETPARHPSIYVSHSVGRRRRADNPALRRVHHSPTPR